MASKLAVITFGLVILSVSAQPGPISGCSHLPPTCSCGPDVVNCTNVQGLSTDALGQIPLYFNKLTTLHLTGNRFNYLDKDIFHLEGSLGWSLKQLDLSNNSITDIHEEAFTKFPSLQELTLSNNQISFLRRPYAAGHRVQKTGTFLDPIAPSLSILDMSNAFDQRERRESTYFLQNLTKLLFDTENPFENLQYLLLSRNDLPSFPSGALQAAPALQYLYLSNNRLTTFQLDEHTGTQLVELHLQANNIQTLDETFTKMVDERATLRKVFLGDNPFTCDCQSRAFINWLKRSSKVQDRGSMHCAKAMPRQFINRSLVTVDEEQLRCSDGKSAVYTAGVFALCSVAAIGLISLLTCIVYANKTFLFRTGANIRNWLTMATSGGYEILESPRPTSVKAEAV